ncbi:MAG: hypothetical protein WC985_09215 [Thermoplasmata archaeon]
MLLLVVLSLLLIVAPSRTRGELPTVAENSDASRTVTWSMNDTVGLAVQNVTMEGGRAVLPWQPESLAWNRAAQFAANGTLAPGMTANASGIGLWGNWSSHVVNGGFTDSGSWTYANGTTQNVTAQWNATLKDAQLAHTSPLNQTMWDSMDRVSGNWALLPATGIIIQNASGQTQGSGMMAINLPTGITDHVGAVRLNPATSEWSAYDRLVVWIKMNLTLPLGFNVTAMVGSTLVGTTNQTLAVGWQEVTVDLNQLAPASQRSSLSQITLRFNGIVKQPLWLYVDDARVGTAKVFDEGASVSQVFDKTNVTTPLRGSAILSFDWCLLNATGVANYTASVNLSANPKDTYQADLDSSTFGTWHSFVADVSAKTSAEGAYNLSFRLWVGVNTTAASNITLFVDSVSLVFPDRHNGTYLSSPLTMGVDSAYPALSWMANLPPATSITVSMRTGNNTNPGSGAWSPWQSFTLPGTDSLSLPGAVYFQLRASLNTSNASVTPVLQSLILTTQHRVRQGLLVSAPFRAQNDFLRWKSFNVTLNQSLFTAVYFSVGNGSSWRSVTPGASLAFPQGPSIQWKAEFVTADGLQTPALQEVQITYEFLGEPARVVVSAGSVVVSPGSVVNVTSGRPIQFSAKVYDAGSHLVPASVAPIVWTTTDFTGVLPPNGTYLPGTPGLHYVNATVPGYAIFESFWVNVTAATIPSSTPPFNLWDAWPVFLVVIAALAGFTIYEIIIRRMFAIDDVFLISKDGRLIMHNTRRMRADRDEDILSGMLTAIVAFIKDSDPEENGELRRFEVGGKTTLLERGNHVFLTSIYSGRVPGWAPKDLRRFVRDLERTFGPAFAKWNGSPEDLQGVKEFMDHFVSRIRYRGPPS